MLIPHVEGVVTHHDFGPIWDLGFVKRKWPAPFEEFLELLATQDGLVVVAGEHANASVKSLHDCADSVSVAETEITQVIDHGIPRNLCVPAVDKLIVHLFDTGEGTVTELDDILVSEVVVGRDEFIA